MKKLTGYKEGEKYILDVKPLMRNYSNIEMNELADIEEKLKKVVENNYERENIVSGIKKKEAEKLLEWIVQNAREGLEVYEEPGYLEDADLGGCCGLGQGITGYTLEHMGLNPNLRNASSIVFGTIGGIHSFLTVEIPIENEETKEVEEKEYLVDTTFRQFFVREEGRIFDTFIKDKKYGNKVAGNEGYMLLHLEGGEQLAREILSKGFVELTEENAKLYGDAFVLSHKNRKNNEKVPTKKELTTGIDGKTYIEILHNPFLAQEIDYDKEELEEDNINLHTPLMKKEKERSKRNKEKAKENNKDKENKIEIEDIDV